VHFPWYIRIAGLFLFICATAATLQQIWKLLRARQLVLTQKDVPLLWGMVRLVAWDPVEGVLLLHNKSVSFADDNLQDGQGGVRFIYPLLGEELALRVPLEVQTLRFSDEKVLTKEYLSVTIRGTMKWRIVDIKRFYLLVSRVLRTTGDHGDQPGTSTPIRGVNLSDVGENTTIGRLLGAAIEWLRLLAEEQTRMVVSKVSSGLLIAERLSSELPEIQTNPQTAPQGGTPQTGNHEWRNAADGLSQTIFGVIAPRVAEYGITIDDVSLQELRLPEEIVQQCIQACKAAYLPVLAQRQAAAKRAELAAEVELLGRESVGARQVVGAAPAFALVDFISQFLNKNLAGSLATTPTASAAIAGALVAQSNPHTAPSIAK
jgi:regulator of protease activity HflC (stomatin/prohibitin superfamily)